MAKTDITVNILSNNDIGPHFKFINTVARVLTGIIFIIAVVFYFREQSEIDINE